jgi:PKD repeat protein
MFLRPLRTLLLIVASLCAAATASAQFAIDWVRPTTGAVGSMLALDAANNVYSTGYNISQMTVIKHDAAGVLQWQRTINGASTAKGTWITTDRSGNAIAVGNHVQASTGKSIGIIVAKFNPQGDLLWQDSIVQSLSSVSRVLADEADNVYVMGVLPILSGTVANGLYKYSPTGTRLWVAPLTYRTPLAMTLSGDRMLVGGSAAPALMVTAAYDTATGAEVWVRTTPSSSGGQDIATGAQGEIYTVGQAGPGPSGTVLAYLVTKHDAVGNPLWERTYPDGDTALRVAVDSAGNPVVTGRVGSYFDWLTMKLDAAGNKLWTRRHNLHLANDEITNALLIGPADEVYIAGQSGPGPDSGNVSYTQVGVARYSGLDGSPQGWFSHLGGARGMGVKLGSDGGVYALGIGEQTVYRIRQGGEGVIHVDQYPVAMATATSAITGKAPLTVSFSSAGSMDPDGTGILTLWTFGDGGSSNATNPSHTYTAPGTYGVILKVTDLVGHTVQATAAQVNVTDTPPPPPAPTSISLSASSVVGGTSVQGTVVVNGTAGGTINLRSSNAAVKVPSSVAVPAGANSASFTVTTSRVRRSVTATITATGGQSSVGTTLTVTPR